MSNIRRKFSDEEKRAILNQAQRIGVTAALRTHSLSYSVFARWKEKFVVTDVNSNKNVLSKKARFELKSLMEENARLKNIIAHQALELERRDEELKRTNSLFGKNR